MRGCCHFTGPTLGRYLLGYFVAMISVSQLRVGYDRRAVAMPIDGNFSEGSLTAVIGANGAGKSTFLKTLAG